MISLNDVLLAASNVPVDDPIAEMWGAMLCGGYTPIVVEYTGSLPITINANGDVLLDYRIYGSSGGCGEATKNIFNGQIEQGYYAFADGKKDTTSYIAAKWVCTTLMPCSGNTEYGIRVELSANLKSRNYGVVWFDSSQNFISSNKFSILANPVIFEVMSPSSAAYYTVDVSGTYSDTVVVPSNINNITIVTGSTAPTDYIPFGYRLPMTVSDGNTAQTVPVYIGENQLYEDEYVDYGEQKVYKRKTLKDIGDTVSVNGDLWDIVNYNNDITRATLLRHETMPDMVYSARQAIYAFPNGLAAGDYHFTIAQHSWVAGDVGKTLTFTLTQAIPDGGQLVLNAAYNETLVGTTISSYASPTTTTAIETVTMIEGDSGTDLGSLTNAGTPASNINSLQKALLGSNEWKTSAQRQYLNSDKAAGSVWIPQTIFDRPPVWAINTVGFMNGLDEDFLSCVADTTYVTVRNTMSDGGGTDTLTDKFYLPSRTEIFGDNEIANTPEGTLYQYYVNATNADRIKYRANSARSWRPRTPYAAYANYVHNVSTTGALTSYHACIAQDFAPACQIDLTKLNNSWILANFYKPTLTPTDPPVPLPALPTIDGTTIIDCEPETKPDEMYVKYIQGEIT